MVNLTRIYTRLGDDGATHLGDMSRVAKTDGRIAAYGTVDEANSQLGVVLALPDVPDAHRTWLRRVQNDLFDVGADLSVPVEKTENHGRPPLRVRADQTAWLEERCDEANADLPPLRSFVLPGGSPAAAHLHVARTVVRRAEREVVALGDAASPEVRRYLNRLSDLLFILARAANAAAGVDEPLWAPGGDL